ncbi:MAG TPA: hypothetical protein VNT30_25660 [Stellaceae bacterium]|nr:hypothetical protein [Stellaceae bacterium]
MNYITDAQSILLDLTPSRSFPSGVNDNQVGRRQAGRLEAPRREELRAVIRAIERGGPRGAGTVMALGMPAIDGVLPDGGLARGAVHEVLGESPNTAAAVGFATLLLARLARFGPVLWCLGTRDLYGAGLAGLGLPTDRLVIVRGLDDRQILWAMEEGLRTPGFAAVLGEPRRLDLVGSRRLQLAAEASGATGIVLRQTSPNQTSRNQASPNATAAQHPIGTSVALTRWQVASLPGAADAALGPRWRVDLLRCRGATASREAGYGSWLVEMVPAEGVAGREEHHAPDPIAVAWPLADRPGEAGQIAERSGRSTGAG